LQSSHHDRGRIATRVRRSARTHVSRVSEAAKAARNVEYAEFDGLRFLCKVGIEPAHGDYKAKNFLAEVITPDRTKDWRPIEQAPKPPTKGGPGNTPTPIIKPKWAS
jgi:hypothetical protein